MVIRLGHTWEDKKGGVDNTCYPESLLSIERKTPNSIP